MQVFWLSQSLEQLPPGIEWLHPTEQEVLDGFKFAKRRNDWLLGRWTAKQCVTRFFSDIKPGASLQNVQIVAASDGAPEVFYKEKPLGCHISISHSHGIGLCAITSTRYSIGCDLEKIEPRSDYFIQDYFKEEEQAIILNIDEKYTPLMANMIWSAKESVVKALRIGLSIDTKHVEIGCLPMDNEGEWNDFTILYPNLDHKLYGKWQFYSGFVFTMVSDDQDFVLVGSN